MKSKFIAIVIVSLCLNLAFITAGIILVSKGYYRKFTAPYLRDYYADKVAHFRSMMPRPRAIVFVGDSLTDRCEWAEFLHRRDVLNRGIEADTTEGISARFDEIMRHRPSKVFILAGGADIMFGRSPDAIERDYRAIVLRILKEAPAATIYIQSLLPTVFRLVRVPRELIREVDRRIKTIADGKRVIYVDLHSAFSDANGDLHESLTTDGTHLNGRGYELWRSRILPLLEDSR